MRLNGVVHDRGAIWDGQGQLPGGEWIGRGVQCGKSAYASKEKKEKKTDALDSLWSTPTGNVWYPLGPMGYPCCPIQKRMRLPQRDRLDQWRLGYFAQGRCVSVVAASSEWVNG
ncbi:MAG: hypothetical protein IPO90_12990 [Flavobacteriales bacterium]|nr:hypothetical protein [Flavobacteriales bacterium]